MQRFGTEEQYQKSVIERFKKSDEPEILIVVDKLLTGFDAPRNTVLYITRSLKEHTLLQAIARVNRLVRRQGVRFHRRLLRSSREARRGARPFRIARGRLRSAGHRQCRARRHGRDRRTAAASHRHVAGLQECQEQTRSRGDARGTGRHGRSGNAFYSSDSAIRSTLQVALSSAQFLETIDPKRVRRHKTDLVLHRSACLAAAKIRRKGGFQTVRSAHSEAARHAPKRGDIEIVTRPVAFSTGTLSSARSTSSTAIGARPLR